MAAAAARRGSARRVACALAFVFGALVAPPGPHAHAAASMRLRFDFDRGDPLTSGSVVHDVSGLGNDGVVAVRYGGSISPVNGAAAFPKACASEPCGNAMIRVASNSSLNPGRGDVEWGASILLPTGNTADGENVVQKGRWGDGTGMWKLQVDKLPGHPSCVVSGRTSSGAFVVLTVKASVGIADGNWHRVVCRRVGRTVTITVDGVRAGAGNSDVVALTGSAPATVGAKEVVSRDNDQFQGRLDDVYMMLL